MSHATRMRPQFIQRVYYLQRYGGPPLRTFSTIPPNTQPDIPHSTITDLASKPLHDLKLRDLARHGRPPLSKTALLQSANFTRTILPPRLAHRLNALLTLPYIVASNPHISLILRTYQQSLSTLLPYTREITTLEEEGEFTNVLADLVQTHKDTIPVLARGFLECRRYLSKDVVEGTLDRHLRDRIGTRVVAEQHIALHLASLSATSSSSSSPSSFLPSPPPQEESRMIGVLDPALNPADTIRQCEAFVGEICELRYGIRPSIQLTGDINVTFAYLPSHLEYILTELLKNAFRATVENTSSPSSSAVDEFGRCPPPIVITIAASADKSGVTIRIQDRGGGIAPNVLGNIWGYSFTTFNEEEAVRRDEPSARAAAFAPTASAIDALNVISASGGGVMGGGMGGGEGGMGGGGAVGGASLAGLGYGLPLGRAYAEHFGGGVEVQTMWGWGTDVYLRLKGLEGEK